MEPLILPPSLDLPPEHRKFILDPRMDTETSLDFQMSPAEVIKLAAVDSNFYSRQFFPKTVRQKSPPIHADMWEAFENPAYRQVLLKAFRGSAKTTASRLFMSKRIAYAISHTIFLVGASEDHAARSVKWIRGQVERNTKWAELFQLRRGSKWGETELEIIHGLDERSIWVLGAGITGNVRGINFDDYRPDLIVLDDVLTDESSATEDQREKMIDLILGAIRKSLISAVEEPNAKLIMLQTPLHLKDAVAEAERDPAWHTLTVSCWTPETQHLDVDDQVSVWPDMYTTEDLRREKKQAIATNRYSKFARENECLLVNSEAAAFKPNWVNVRTGPAKKMPCVLSIDPVPPPSELALAKGLQKKDYEVQMVMGRDGGDYHVLDYVKNRGHNPNWSIATMFEMGRKWSIQKVVVETVAYQMVLKWILRKAMERAGVYYPIVEFPRGNRSKFVHITNALMGPASQGHLWIGSDMLDFKQQFELYPAVDHDDVLDAAAIAMSELVRPYLEIEGDYKQREDDFPDLPSFSRAP